MFTAIEKTTNETVFIGDIHGDRLKTLRQRNFVDPIFYRKVFPRKGHQRKNFYVRPHFVSQCVNELTQEVVDQSDVIFDPEYVKQRKSGVYTVNESYEHILGKETIAQWVKENVYPELENKKIVYEHRLFIPSKNKYRIIDVALLFPCGVIYAFECQISPITLEDCEERYYDYQSTGTNSFWFFGEKSYSPDIASFLYRNAGYYPMFIDISENSESAFSEDEGNDHFSSFIPRAS